MSNWLILCGTKGAEGTCHHAFDTFKMGFWNNSNRWQVVGGKHDGKPVELKSNPHKVVLQAHLRLMREGHTKMNTDVVKWCQNVDARTPFNTKLGDHNIVVCEKCGLPGHVIDMCTMITYGCQEQRARHRKQM